MAKKFGGLFRGRKAKALDYLKVAWISVLVLLFLKFALFKRKLKMKKVLIAVAVLAAVGTAYLYDKQDSLSDKSTEQALQLSELTYIPADTLMFAGQLKPFPVKEYIKLLSQNKASYEQFGLMANELSKGDLVGQKFFASLLQTYNDTLKSPDLLMQNYGVKDSFKSLFYTVGLLPVMRYEISQPEALWNMLAKAETDSGLKATVHTISDVEYKSYAFYEENGQVFELIASVNDGWATLTFNTPINEQKELALALAINKPEKSLASENILDAMMKKHSFDATYVGFFNHVALVNGLTNKDNNRFNKMLNKILALSNTDLDEKDLSIFREKTCQDDLSQLVSNWPRTVFGTHQLEITDTSVNMKASMVIEGNTDLMRVLAGLRGFIPEHLHSADNKIMSLGLGLDIAKVTPVLTTLWNDFTQTKYQCAPLVDIQTEIAKNSPMMTAMFTGMASDVKGFSVSLFDFELSNENDQPALKLLDSLVTLSVKNPISFFNSVKTFYPPLADLNLPEDGTPVSLNKYVPMLDEFGAQIDVAVKGDNIALYSGEKASETADGLMKQTLINNGVNSFSLDYKKFFTPLFDVAAMANQELPEELNSLKDTDMRIHFLMDYTDNGIEFVSTLDSKIK